MAQSIPPTHGEIRSRSIAETHELAAQAAQLLIAEGRVPKPVRTVRNTRSMLSRVADKVFGERTDISGRGADTMLWHVGNVGRSPANGRPSSVFIVAEGDDAGVRVDHGNVFLAGGDTYAKRERLMALPADDPAIYKYQDSIREGIRGLLQRNGLQLPTAP